MFDARSIHLLQNGVGRLVLEANDHVIPRALEMMEVVVPHPHCNELIELIDLAHCCRGLVPLEQHVKHLSAFESLAGGFCKRDLSLLHMEGKSSSDDFKQG